MRISDWSSDVCSSDLKAGVAVVDLMTGMYATVAILAALFERRSSGLGQHIDMALLDCQVAMLANQNMNYLSTGEAPQRAGNAHPNLVPYQGFAASDGHQIGRASCRERECQYV